ncbi:MAG: hypothetical protein Q8P51_04960 [Ignavibacteria bacterium]|nr:hypothetical protein [Ignavibacteria bacterium]
MRCLIRFSLFLLTGLVAFAGDVPVLDAKDLREAKITKTDFYAGKALFGYIDGGAELYLEYRFKKLGRQEVLYSGEKYVVEVYQMAGPREAFGIFSVQRFKCVPVDTLLPNICQSRYQLQAVAGDCYLSIINESGSVSAQKASIRIFRAIAARIKPQQIDLPAVFRTRELKPHLQHLIIAFGTLGVQNGFDEWRALFGNTPRFALILLPIEAEGGRVCFSRVQFESAEELDGFVSLAGFANATIGSTQRTGHADVTRLLRRLNEREVLYVEITGSSPDQEVYTRLLENR